MATSKPFIQRALFTKNGQITGNAILVREIDEEETNKLAPSLTDYLKNTNQKLYWVETDFGNTMRLSTNEINGMFTYGHEQDYDRWSAARRQLINGTRTQS